VRQFLASEEQRVVGNVENIAYIFIHLSIYLFVIPTRDSGVKREVGSNDGTR